MDLLFDYFIFTYPGALFLILFGIYYYRRVLNDKREEYDYIRISAIWQGIGGSIMLIIAGILIFYFKIKGEM
jgi:hypothetical protein